MTIKRLDHVSVVVDDLAAAIAFFIALGMTLEGEMPVEGPWVDRVNGYVVASAGAILSLIFLSSASISTHKPTTMARQFRLAFVRRGLKTQARSAPCAQCHIFRNSSIALRLWPRQPKDVSEVHVLKGKDDL